MGISKQVLFAYFGMERELEAEDDVMQFDCALYSTKNEAQLLSANAETEEAN